MKTGVDTNIFSILWSAAPNANRMGQLLVRARSQGSLVLCPIVYAEMLANPVVERIALDEFLQETGVVVEFDLIPDVWREAGVRFGNYSVRKRRSGGGEARRLLADFVVGAHALLQADRLLTFDVKRYAVDFPELTLV